MLSQNFEGAPTPMRRIFLTLLLFISAVALCAQQSLNNDAIIKLSKAGLSPELIISTINATPGTFDTSPDGLIALKKAKVDDKVVAALLAKTSGAAVTPAADQGLPAAVDTIGTYYKDTAGNWKEVPVETVSFKSSGTLKHVASVGIVKGERNGLINNTQSHLAIKTPAEFILYLPEGRSPNEYELLRLRINGTAREFRAPAPAAAKQPSNAIHDTVDFTSRKIAPRAYAITLDSGIGKGEYGFLPPLESNEKNPTSGKIYSFTIADSVSQ
jgi:hypothetical protein